jgi:hypothetical protein
MSTMADIADYLCAQTPDHEGDICVAFTSEQRDQIVAALLLRDAVEPFLAYTRAQLFRLLPDDFVVTKGSEMAHGQLTVRHFRALLGAADEALKYPQI